MTNSICHPVASVKQWADPDAPLSAFAQTILDAKYAHTKHSGQKESWPEIARRVAQEVCGKYLPKDTVHKIEKLIQQRKLMPGGRYLYAAGRDYHQINNCFLLRCHDSKEGWADLFRRATLCLCSGGGIGVVYDDVRPEGSLVRGLGGFATGPLSPMQGVNEIGRHIRQGGARRSAIWARLGWKHKDVQKFIAMKNWPDYLKKAKDKDFNAAAPMDMTNISVGLDDDFFSALQCQPFGTGNYKQATEVYWATVRSMLQTAEPGFSIDTGENGTEQLRNACTEVTSADDNDVCDLASLVLPRFQSLNEFEEAVDLGVAFLLCGTLYSDLPYEECKKVVEKNRRLGLGLMGAHEWLLRHGKSYGPDDDLGHWLDVYATSTEKAHIWSDRLGISRSVKTRAMAPNGTISIVGETTGCMEPIFAVALKRRYLDGKSWKYQYIVDAAAQRLIDSGVDPESIEDAYELAEDVERRVKFQHWFQKYVDHGISSTINLPAWGSSVNNEDTVKPFGKMLLRYLPGLRGVTCYPDGSRGGQPLTHVKYQTAVKHLGQVFEEGGEVLSVEEYSAEVGCPGGVCGV